MVDNLNPVLEQTQDEYTDFTYAIRISFDDRNSVEFSRLLKTLHENPNMVRSSTISLVMEQLNEFKIDEQWFFDAIAPYLTPRDFVYRKAVMFIPFNPIKDPQMKARLMDSPNFNKEHMFSSYSFLDDLTKYPDLFCKAIEMGANMNLVNSFGKTIMEEIIQTRLLERSRNMIECMLEHGYDIHTTYPNRTGVMVSVASMLNDNPQKYREYIEFFHGKGLL